MSTQATQQSRAPAASQSTPIADRLNSDTDWDGEQKSAEETIEAFVGPSPKIGGGRPHVLNHQVPPVIGKAVLTTIPVEPLFQYQREEETTTAFRIGDTSQR